jgi:hypothetical protein
VDELEEAQEVAGEGPLPMAAPSRTKWASRQWPAAMVMLAVLGMFLGGEVDCFRAYDCANTTNRVDVYSLLEPADCPSVTPHHAVERTIFGEIVKIKSERRVPVFRCKKIVTITSQYCGFLSAGGIVRYLKFLEPRRVEVQDCCLAQMTGKLAVGGKELPVTIGTSTSHSSFLAGDLTDAGDCSTGVIEMKMGEKLEGQATQAVYEITVTEGYAKINDLRGTITFDSGIAAKIGDLGLTDSMEGTYVWRQTAEACPRSWCSCTRG